MRALVTLLICVIYVVVWFRKDLDDVNTLMAVVIAGVIALASLLYAVFSPRLHHRVTKILAGSGALVATSCAGAFVHYTWTEWARLKDTRLLGLLLFFCTVSSVAMIVAWIAFWRCKWSPTHERTPPTAKSTVAS